MGVQWEGEWMGWRCDGRGREGDWGVTGGEGEGRGWGCNGRGSGWDGGVMGGEGRE